MNLSEIFYEFIAFQTNMIIEETDAIPLSEVKLNTNYELVITTNTGLWRYRIGDTIRFTSLTPYRIQVTGRTKHHINAFGEELIIDNAERAISTASKLTSSVVSNYTRQDINPYIQTIMTLKTYGPAIFLSIISLSFIIVT